MADIVQAQVTIHFYLMTSHFHSSNYNSFVSVRNEFLSQNDVHRQTRVHVNYLYIIFHG